MADKRPKKITEEVKATNDLSPPDVKEEKKKEEIVVEKVVKQDPLPKQVVTEPLVPFERWFRARAKERKYRAHWVDGMKAFTDVTRRRTMEQWDSVFAKY